MAAANTTRVNVLSYGSTNVTSSAYVELVAATPFPVSRIQVSDTSTKLLKIATGAASSEVDIVTCPISGSVLIPYQIPAGTRLSIKAIDATASTGYNVVTFLP